MANKIDLVNVTEKMGFIILTPRFGHQSFDEYNEVYISKSGTVIGKWGNYRDYILTKFDKHAILVRKTSRHLIFLSGREALLRALVCWSSSPHIHIPTFLKDHVRGRAIAPLKERLLNLLKSRGSLEILTYERTSDIFITKGTKRGQRNRVYFLYEGSYISHLVIRKRVWERLKPLYSNNQVILDSSTNLQSVTN